MQNCNPSEPSFAERRPRAFVIDDHAIVRAALKLMLQDAGVEVAGDCGDPRLALERAVALQPDLVLLDITMPGLSGLDLLPKLRAVLPAARIVMVSHLGGRTVVDRAFAAGADGFVAKDAAPETLLATVRAVLAGERRVEQPAPGVTAAGATPSRAKVSGSPAVGARCPLDTLTPREREVLQILVLGKTNKEVCRELGISVSTVKKHRENLQRKLECGSSAELARLAIREGLLEP